MTANDAKPIYVIQINETGEIDGFRPRRLFPTLKRAQRWLDNYNERRALHEALQRPGTLPSARIVEYQFWRADF